MFRDSVCLNSEQLSAPRPTPKLEDHSWSAVRHCLFNIFASTLHNSGRSSTRNLSTRHTVVTGTHCRHVVTEQQVVSSVTKKKPYFTKALLYFQKPHDFTVQMYLWTLAARRLPRKSQMLNITRCSPLISNFTQIGQEIWIV